MRALRVAALLVPTLTTLTTVASAENKPIVFGNRVLGPQTREAGPVPLTSVSHTLYLNDCKPNGCTVSQGFDNSLTNRSSIAQGTRTLSAWSYSDTHWNALVDCVKATFRPFNIDVVTTDPGNTSHFEVMVGGTSRQLNDGLDAGGVAPFIDCGATQNNVISFVFAAQTSDLNFLCGAVAQEASHVWGLDHELNKDDPMTYLDLGSSKRFQNSDTACGEDTPRGCQCGGNTQNSFVYLKDTFGMSPTLSDPTLSVDKPADGQWLKPGFPIAATLTSELSIKKGTITIDGAALDSFQGSKILAWNAPMTLTSGKHTIAVEITDAGERKVTQSVTVNVMAACSAGCPSGTVCFEGLCTPGANEPGGLGADCTANSDCATDKCASDGSDSLCTGSCDASGACPSGFDCVDGNLCWPSASGGCAVMPETSRSGSGGLAGFVLAFGLGALVLTRRRR